MLWMVSPVMAAEDVSYLLTAASKGDLPAVKALLDSGASANAKDEDGITALMYAARKDKFEVVSALLNKGADINAKDNGGWTALMFAAKKIQHTCCCSGVNSIYMECSSAKGWGTDGSEA